MLCGFLGLNSLVLALQIFHRRMGLLTTGTGGLTDLNADFSQCLSRAVKVLLAQLDLRNSRLVLKGPSVPVINAIDGLFSFPGKYRALLKGPESKPECHPGSRRVLHHPWVGFKGK